MSRSKLESQAPELAKFGKARMHNKVAYLATVRKNGSSRVHPFTPIIEFEVESVLVTEYKANETIRTRWKAGE